METMNKIKCPRCPKGVLFAIDNSIKNGIIEGKCQWCSSIIRYNTKTKEYEVVSTKNNIK